MFSFRTPLAPSPSTTQTGHSDRLFLIGSCFTEHIGKRLADRKFRVATNPNGIVYNPVSIAQCLDRLLVGDQYFEEGELVENGGLWHSWSHHSQFSKPERTSAIQGINEAYKLSVEQLRQADVLLITLGSADVFHLIDTQQIVANNHKMPAAHFQQKRLSVAAVTEVLSSTFSKLLQEKPRLKIVLTVSPVRHIRNGLVENQRSKAVLLLACEALCAAFPQATYFPSYELMMDDLRDYRFYADDMLHPSTVAVDYIWDFFSQTFFSPETRALNASIEKILAAAQHRPFNPDTAAHRSFAAAQIEAVKVLLKNYPDLDFTTELNGFERMLVK